jgi:hypothetical protein
MATIKWATHSAGGEGVEDEASELLSRLNKVP